MRASVGARIFEELGTGQRAWVVDYDVLSALHAYNCRRTESKNSTVGWLQK